MPASITGVTRNDRARSCNPCSSARRPVRQGRPHGTPAASQVADRFHLVQRMTPSPLRCYRRRGADLADTRRSLSRRTESPTTPAALQCTTWRIECAPVKERDGILPHSALPPQGRAPRGRAPAHAVQLPDDPELELGGLWWRRVRLRPGRISWDLLWPRGLKRPSVGRAPFSACSPTASRGGWRRLEAGSNCRGTSSFSSRRPSKLLAALSDRLWLFTAEELILNVGWT
jgi:hypothetical protein